MAQASNPYETPKAAVSESAGETQPVKLFSVSGRIGRARYIAYGIGLYVLISLLGGVLGAVLGSTAGVVALVVMWVALLVVSFMLTIQRCHDFNTSGWLSIVVLVPLVNLMFWFIPGTDGPNRYGPPTPPNNALVIVGVCVLPLLFIVGILAAVSIPAYSDYRVRAKMSEVILAASACRTSITDIYQSGGSAPGANKWSCEAATSKYVGGIATSVDGKVTVTTAGGLPAGVVTLVPLKAGPPIAPALAADLNRGPVTLHGWRCGNAPIDGTTVSPKYLPGSCRGQ
jgi:uncharacterized membrane protein YhaH (DUF805 family)/type II secretory pathway pseudopilin PulG